MKTSEPKDLTTPSGPLRWKKKKGVDCALIRCVGCRRHIWVGAEEAHTRLWCSNECKVERTEAEARKKERERRRAELKKKGKRKDGKTTHEDGRPGAS